MARATGLVFLTTPLYSPSVSSPSSSSSKRLTLQLSSPSHASHRIYCSTSTSEAASGKLPASTEFSVTGGAYDFSKATTSLTNQLISSSKKVILLRHGLSTWNAESRIQGSSDLSILTKVGEEQAERCKKALENMYFDQCFASPISRAKQTAEIIWQGREKPLVYVDSLKEISLYHLEGMRNESVMVWIHNRKPRWTEATSLHFCDCHRDFGRVYEHELTALVDAKIMYPKEYTTWREDPANFCMNGRYPAQDLWLAARDCWKEILLSPGESFLVVTHKSILRALTCTALGLGPERFRSIDINNGGICVFKFNVRGEAMLEALNATAHMYGDHVYPG